MNKRTIRFLLPLTIVIVMAVVMAGCTVSVGPPGEGASPPAQDQTTIETAVAQTVQAQMAQTAVAETPAGQATDTSIPSTDTPAPPTDTPSAEANTPAPATNTPAQPTDTPAPPTDTPAPPTNTPIPPTDTPAPPTDTPAPPTPTPEPQHANLKIDWIRLNPDPPVQGQPVHVELQVYNHGNALANGNFNVAWWAGSNFADGPHCTWTLNGLVAGGGRVLSCDYPGYASWYANIDTMARVDTTNAIPESNEGDNELRMRISVSKPPTPTPLALPNLKVDWIKFNPDPPVQGQPVQVKLQVYNHGNARANGGFVVDWWAGVHFADGPHCRWQINGMNAGGGRVLTCTYAGYASWYGRLETMARADVENAIHESNESDNELHKFISVAKP